MVGAGIGSSVASYDAADALLQDTERATGNVAAIGAVDLRIPYAVGYYDAVDGTTETTRDIINGEPEPSFEIDQIHPGDSGQIVFCPEVVDNPAYLWLCGGITKSADGGRSGGSGANTGIGQGGPPDTSHGELAAAIQATLGYCSRDSDGVETVLLEGSLAGILTRLTAGIPLDAVPESQGLTAPGDQACFEPGPGDETANPCLCLEWTCPDDTGNVVQGDSFQFDLVFHARQCRHNDGRYNPCARRKGISFVSFCAGDGVAADAVRIDGVSFNDKGEPISVTWSSETPIDTVVLKYSTLFENFHVDGATSGTVTVGAGDEVVSQFTQNEQTPSDPCPDGESGIKFEYDGGSFDVEE